VAGYSYTAGGGVNIRAFLSGPGGGPLINLGTLGTTSTGIGINNAGQVVGTSQLSSGGPYHAFLYSGGQMLDLNSLIATGSGFTLIQATGISDTGYITGVGTAANGEGHAFLLTPVPEPAGWVLLGTGAMGLLGYTAWRRARPCARASPIWSALAWSARSRSRATAAPAAATSSSTLGLS
jgi:probable HAF family extracellular repeat protein